MGHDFFLLHTVIYVVSWICNNNNYFANISNISEHLYSTLRVVDLGNCEERGCKMTEISWIKLKTDLFENDKIKLIEALPAADTIIVIWLKLLTAAGKSNANGYIMLTENMPMTIEEMATIFNRDINTVRLALQTFERYGMITLEEDAVYIKNWEMHQNIDGMERVRKQNRERKQKQRAKEKQLKVGHALSRDSHAIDIDKEKEIEEEKENISNTIYESVVSYLNVRANTSYRATSKATKQLIDDHLQEGFTQEDFIKVIDHKVATWHNTKFAKYLRPQTLFGPKFEGYLNERVIDNENVRGSNDRAPKQSKPSLKGFCSN